MKVRLGGKLWTCVKGLWSESSLLADRKDLLNLF